MATIYYLGVDGNLNNILNWSTGAIPQVGDDVVIGTGSTTIDTSLATPISLTSVTFTAGFTGSWRTSAGAQVLLWTSITGKLRYGGRGTVAVFGSASGTVANTVLEHGAGQIVGLTSGTYTHLANGLGTTTIDPACVIASGAATNMIRNQGGQLTIGYNATAIAGELLNSAGTTTVRRNFLNGTVTSGSLIQTDGGTTSLCKATGTIRVGGRGVYNKQSTDTDTSVAHVAQGGTYSLLGNTGTQSGTVNVGTVNFCAGAIDRTNGVPGITVAGTREYFGGIGSDGFTPA